MMAAVGGDIGNEILGQIAFPTVADTPAITVVCMQELYTHPTNLAGLDFRKHAPQFGNEWP